MKSMEVYKDDAQAFRKVAATGTDDQVRFMAPDAANCIEALADEVTRLRKKLRKKNKKIAELKEKAWMYDELDK